jgi:hypothetical protein
VLVSVLNMDIVILDMDILLISIDTKDILVVRVLFKSDCCGSTSRVFQSLL